VPAVGLWLVVTTAIYAKSEHEIPAVFNGSCAHELIGEEVIQLLMRAERCRMMNNRRCT